jgi:hypothetical protein
MAVPISLVTGNRSGNGEGRKWGRGSDKFRDDPTFGNQGGKLEASVLEIFLHMTTRVTSDGASAEEKAVGEGVVKEHTGDVAGSVGRLRRRVSKFIADVNVFRLLVVATVGSTLGDHELETVALVSGHSLQQLVPETTVGASEATAGGGEGALAALNHVGGVRID